jgi:DNA-binding transcriptional MerR regulator
MKKIGEKDMKQPLSIGDISKLLNVPKSTLRYWESEGLIDLNRNDSNKYREYTRNTLVGLSDLVYYRSLNMPIKEMKRLKEVNPFQLKDILNQMEDGIDEEISRLLSCKLELNNRIQNMECYMQLVKNPYQHEKLDFEKLYSFDYNSPKAWADCINDQCENIILYEMGSKSPEICMTKTYSVENRLVWECKNSNKTYVTFPLAVEYGNPLPSDFMPHFDYLKSMGYETKNILGRYLFSAFDGRHCDFYKGYAEIINYDEPNLLKQVESLSAKYNSQYREVKK